MPEAVAGKQLLCLSAAVKLIERAEPSTAWDLRRFVRGVLPLGTVEMTAHLSSSVRQYPFVVASTLADPAETIALLCHEYHHLKLFLLEEVSPLMDRPATPLNAPWRPDTRSALGVYHGAYVFYQVAELFGAIFRIAGASPRGAKRMAVWRVCVATALGDVRRADVGLSAVGMALLDRLAEANAQRLNDADVQPYLAFAHDAVDRHLALAGTAAQREPWFLGV